MGGYAKQHRFDIMTIDVLFSRPTDVNNIGAKPLTKAVAANLEERSKIADAMDLLGLNLLEGELVVTRRAKSGGVDVTGTLHAEFTQSCVVTLEELPCAIQRDISITYLPEDEMPELQVDQYGDLAFDLEEDDAPELLVGSLIDLGHIILEELSLNIDPFPRKADAQLPFDEEKGPAPMRESPFSVLQALKK